MRTIERSNAFKRELKGQNRALLDTKLRDVIVRLASDAPLDVMHRDHALSGAWKDFRDCHIRPDLVLIYKQIDEDRLLLARLGSHSELDF